MNLPQAKLLLEKIITLYKTVSADEKNISAIERDLMLSYTRQLYEAFSDSTPSVLAAPKVAQAVVQPPPPAPRPVPPPPVVEQPRIVYEAPKPPVVEPPRVVEYQQPRVAPSPPPAPPPLPPAPVLERPRPIVQTQVSSEVQALFEENSGKELSDKLSGMPIADLSKAFGLNDRLLNQNELFGGSKTYFDEAIKDLNSAYGFDSAKNLLVDMAQRHNWTATEDRKKQAKSFIKLVRRRFS